MSSPSSTDGYFEYDNLQLRHNFLSCYVHIGYDFRFAYIGVRSLCSTYTDCTGNDLGLSLIHI